MHRTTILAGAIMATLALPSTALADGAVRVLHASPDAPAVDVYVNGAKTVSALDRGAITPYLSLAAGRYRYAIRITDTDGITIDRIDLDTGQVGFQTTVVFIMQCCNGLSCL